MPGRHGPERLHLVTWSVAFVGMILERQSPTAETRLESLRFQLPLLVFERLPHLPRFSAPT